ncbi:uncharacterized protein LOC123543087 isoform X1 [Mercenaria mercenaria]|uniref:uncharacterized protein LOC123543087 isoform X1 n=1 Tax=Mercenaria mercenaria TaxID=6596 RepID=UPI00234E83AF|nr:uncharacterized protein LOC123543087 isoform X1 [Mercenaria mercenaria]
MADLMKHDTFEGLAADHGNDAKRKNADYTGQQYSAKKQRTDGVQEKGNGNGGCNPGFPATERSVAIASSVNGNTTAGLSTGTSRSVALEYSTLGNTTAASIRLDEDDQKMRDDDQEMRAEQQEMKDKHLE